MVTFGRCSVHKKYVFIIKKATEHKLEVEIKEGGWFMYPYSTYNFGHFKKMNIK